MSFAVYKVVHIFGVLLTFLALGGLALHAQLTDGSEGGRARRMAGISHGLGLIIILVSGLGALARLGAVGGEGIPLWVWLKFAVWLVLGGSLVVLKRRPSLAATVWWLLPIVGALAAYLAVVKPGG